MKIKDIITEGWNADHFGVTARTEIEEIATILVRDCHPYFEQNRSAMPLYRGTTDSLHGAHGRMYKGETRATRNPLDTFKKDHLIADQWFLENFGIAYRSDHVMFCSGSKVSASTYGKLYIVAPIGQFTFCWADQIKDMADRMPKTNVMKLDDPRDDLRKEMIYKELNAGDYRDKDLMGGIIVGHEIMVRCGAYYALSCNQDFYDAVIETVHEKMDG